MCACLARYPDKTNVKYVASEPYAGNNWLIKLVNDGSIATIFWSVVGVISLILVILFWIAFYFGFIAVCYPKR